MVELKAQSPAAGLLPQTIGAIALTEAAVGTITALMVRPRQAAALDRALRAAHGVGWPAPGVAESGDAASCCWAGLGTAFLIGPDPDPGLAQFAGVSDQSDAWVVIDVRGPQLQDLFARVTPIDLAAFTVGRTARTLCQHVPVSIIGLPEGGFRVMAFRSMARTLVQDLTEAARSVAARGAL